MLGVAMRRLSLAFLALAAAMPGHAAPLAPPLAPPLAAGGGAAAPVFAPPPAWVHGADAAGPAFLVPPPGFASLAAITLLRDQQYSFSPQGDDMYIERIVRVQTPAGLSAAGTITLPWDPATQTLTIHRLRILRGGASIDVLATQAFTILRRENNLEDAMLDGWLTAAIQPAGLLVGDSVDLAYTIHRVDPAMGGRSERVIGWPNLPFAHLRLRATWPAALPMQWRANRAIEGLHATTLAGRTELALAADDVQPELLPEHAPARYGDGPEIDVSAFAGWRDVADQFRPLYARAAAIGPQSPLQAEIARIRATAKGPEAQAAAALALVQDQVRYLFLGTNDGGLVPAPADLTWSRRFGDCKGKTTLLLALLHGLGIDAAPVLVSADDGDGLNARLPMIGHFDHVLIRAVIHGRAYWLDGTRMGDRRLTDLAVPGYYWGLSLAPGTVALTPITPTPLARPSTATTIRIDATAGIALPAPFHVTETLTGDAALEQRRDFDDMTQSERDYALRDNWSRRYDFVDIKSVTARFNDATGEEILTMDGLAHMDWSGDRYETDDMELGYRVHFSRPPGVYVTAPFAVAFPVYYSHHETILLPHGGAGFTLSGEDIDRSAAGMHFHRVTRLDHGVFEGDASTRSVQPEFPAAEAASAQDAINDLRKSAVYIRTPDHYEQTQAETAAERARPLANAAAYVDRGVDSMRHDDYAPAIEDFSKALALDPRHDLALADRGIAYVMQDNIAAAKRDFAAATLINAKNPVLYRGLGALAMKAHQYAEAIADFTTSLHYMPGDAFTLGERAWAYHCAGNDDSAMADYAALLRITPDNFDVYLFRARFFKRKAETARLMAEAAAVTAANPKNAEAYNTAGQIYTMAQQPPLAARAFDRMVELAPTAGNCLIHARHRPVSDRAGRAADVEAALNHDVNSVDAWFMRADMQYQAGAYADALSSVNVAISIKGATPVLLAMRGAAFRRAGQLDKADKDFRTARAKATIPAELNDLCWFEATSGAAPDVALAACDAALAKVPGHATFLDSRGFALLRLNRFADAVADYTAALSQRPDAPMSLYGRAVAFRRLGNLKASEADLQAARRADSGVGQVFATFGVAL